MPSAAMVRRSKVIGPSSDLIACTCAAEDEGVVLAEDRAMALVKSDRCCCSCGGGRAFAPAAAVVAAEVDEGACFSRVII